MSMTRRGFLSRRDHLLDRVRADDLGALGFLVEEIVHLGDGAVESDHGEPVVVHVENEILAHYSKANYSDVGFWFHNNVLSGRPEIYRRPQRAPE